MNSKVCKACNVLKSLDEYTNQYSGKTSAFKKTIVKYNVCKACNNERARNWRKTHKGYKGSGKVKNIPAEDRLLWSAVSQRLVDAKGRLRRSNSPILCDLTPLYLVDLFKNQKGMCAISGIKLELETNTLSTLSLDKIIPEKGYVVGNVQWLAWKVNRAKGEMSTEDFISMCRIVIEKCNDYSERK